MSKIYSEILSVGSYLPKKILTNFDFEKTIDTTNEWIVQRTGSLERHIAEETEFTSDLAFIAANNAINNAKIDKNLIDIIIVATITSDKTFPSTAAFVHKKLALNRNIPAFDISVACSGFVYAIEIADSMIKSEKYNYILIIGAEKLSSITDFKDRSTCVLFGDGAGACILKKKIINNDIENIKNTNESCIIDSKLELDSKYIEILQTTGGVSSTQNSGFITMNGQEVFKLGVNKLSEMIEQILQKNNINSNDIKMIIPHQSNYRILKAIADKINIPYEKFAITIDKHANTSAASIPLALNVMFENNKIQKGDLLLFISAGAGMSFGCILVRF